jgi:4-diphosphocytidyl-2-C-methyl-D-erythritol kinase
MAVSLYDDVTVAAAEDWGVTVSGPLAAGVPEDGDNLAMRAARLVEAHFDIDPVHIAIRKGIPVAGGMAGGSADAAATLVALDHLWDLDLDREELEDLASELGSDVPFLIAGGTAMGSGRGELLAPVLARGTYHWVFALAEGGLSTPSRLRRVRPAACRRGFRCRTPRPPRPHERPAHRRPPRARMQLSNDLQAASLSLRPALAEVLAAGMEYGALGGIVSGSGPTTAFLVENNEAGIDLAVALTASGVVATCGAPAAGPRRPRDPPADRLVANLVSVERASLALGTAQVLDAVSPRGRWTATASASSVATAVARPPSCGCCRAPGSVDTGRVASVGGLTVGVLTQDDGSTRQPPCTRPSSVTSPSTSGPPAPASATSSTGLLGGLDAPAVGGMDALGGAVVRWRAPAGGAGRPARLRARPAAARRTDQPPRRRRGGLAGRPPRAPARTGRTTPSSRSPTTAGSSTRSPPSPGRSTPARSSPTRAATRPTCWPRPNASGWPG